METRISSVVALARGVLNETLHGPVPKQTVAQLAEAVIQFDALLHEAANALADIHYASGCGGDHQTPDSMACCIIGAITTARTERDEERERAEKAEAEVARLRERMAELERWDDAAPRPEDADIAAAHPTQTGNHARYAEAMRLVNPRRSWSSLVALVNWLLAERDTAVERAEDWERRFMKLSNAPRETLKGGG